MGIAVAALGSLAGSVAGGYAQKAISNNWSPDLRADTSIPNILEATVRKPNKEGKGGVYAPQVSATEAFGFFDQAASKLEEQYLKGLNLYEGSLATAASALHLGYAEANSALRPLSDSAVGALNEQMKMLGLAPVSKTGQTGTLLREQLSGYAQSLSPEANTYFKGLLDDLDKAELTKDTAARAQLKGEILQKFAGVEDVFNGDAKTKLAALKIEDAPFTAPAPREEQDAARKAAWTAAAQSGAYKWNKAGYQQWLTKTLGDETATYNANRESWLAQSKAGYQGKLDSNLGISVLTDQAASDWERDYSDEYQTGYTGQQVSDRIAATPGYQFQMDQGVQAVDRRGAAAGMLGSGNTLNAETTYGQYLAMSQYGMYMDNLSKVVAEGSPATSQISQNYRDESRDLASMSSMLGQAYGQTYEGIGQAYNKSLADKGQTSVDVARFNAEMQMKAQMMAAGASAQEAGAASQATPGVMQAQTNAAMFNYSVFQNQQAAQAYATRVQ